MFALAVLVYGAAALYSILVWRRGFEREERISYALVLLGFCPHTLALLARGLALHRCPVGNLFEVTAFLAWSLAVVYLLAGLWRPLRFLGALVAPVLFGLGVAALTPGLDKPTGPPLVPGHALLSLHATVTLVAYGLLGLAALAGVMFLVRERDLRNSRLRGLLARLPPLQRLAGVAWRLVQTGFALLTIGLALGGLVPPPDGARLSGDPKVLWAALLWLLYAALVVWRRRGLPMRRFAWAAAGLFGFTLLTFWGASLASPLHRP